MHSQLCRFVKKNPCHLPWFSPGISRTENTNIYKAADGLAPKVVVQNLRLLPIQHRASLTNGIYSQRDIWGRKSTLQVNKLSAKIRRVSLKKDHDRLPESLTCHIWQPARTIHHQCAWTLILCYSCILVWTPKVGDLEGVGGVKGCTDTVHSLTAARWCSDAELALVQFRGMKLSNTKTPIWHCLLCLWALNIPSPTVPIMSSCWKPTLTSMTITYGRY